MAQKKVTIVIGEQPYTITTDEPESYLQELARRVDEMIRQTRAGNPRVSANMAAVLTAVTLADEAHRAEETADHLRVRLREYMAENDRLQKRLDGR
ncbi:MAG: cell division protein ZapA [Acutalibacteraceae bacterium]|jgi:cell division protein ZapA (FtsZ GTPase activity inhibitor)